MTTKALSPTTHTLYVSRLPNVPSILEVVLTSLFVNDFSLQSDQEKLFTATRLSFGWFVSHQVVESPVPSVGFGFGMQHSRRLGCRSNCAIDFTSAWPINIKLRAHQPPPTLLVACLLYEPARCIYLASDSL